MPTRVHADSHVPIGRRSPEGLALLSALQGRPRPPAEAASSAADWRARALSVYREVCKALSRHGRKRIQCLVQLALAHLKGAVPS